MPRKKEKPCAPLPGFDIFDQPLKEADHGVLVKPRYRRKQLAGFVPLWNEFFRCYHLAGVSPNAVYLWAYLRQHEHERREWNAVSDISWLGRRDLAETLGVSIAHLPNLLQQLREADLLAYQPVLPGFEELAQTMNSDVDSVRQKAAELGVNPKSDATLYRTSDPFTKTEFATYTSLKFCKQCKIMRYCDGAREAQARLQKPALEPQRTLKAKPKAAQLETSPVERQIEVAAGRYQEDTVVLNAPHQVIMADSTLNRTPSISRVSTRITAESASVTKKERSPTLLRNQTINQPINQQNNTNQNSPAAPAIRVQAVAPTILIPTAVGGGDDPGKILLQNFGFDPAMAARLAAFAYSNGRDETYLRQIVQYSRKKAQLNPLGMARKLIERGEYRLPAEAQWKQPSLFASDAVQPEANLDALADDFAENLPTDISEQIDITDKMNFGDKVCQEYQLPATARLNWQELLSEILPGNASTDASQPLAILKEGFGFWQQPGKMCLIFKTSYNVQYANRQREAIRQAILAATGSYPELEISQF